MRRTRNFYILATALFVAVAVALSCSDRGEHHPGCDGARSLPQKSTPSFTYKIVNSWPHDSSAFTQGLVYEDGVLYESTGEYGRSSLRRVELETGQVLKQRDLERQFFGEGITLWRDRIVQLTWRSQQGFVYDKRTFALLKTFSYDTEGWGITQDGAYLIMSDGTSTLRFLDPETFRVVKSIQVRDENGPVNFLNELEYVKGEIYANVWRTDRIARISPSTGCVMGWVNLAGLLPDAERADVENVLNGIAYDPERDRLFVTGKRWPKLFEITLVLQK